MSCVTKLGSNEVTTLKTPKFTISLEKGNNVIKYQNKIIIIEKMEKYNGNLLFKGMSYIQVSQSLYNLYELNLASEDVGVYVVDTILTPKILSDTIICTYAEISTSLNKMIQIPLKQDQFQRKIVFIELLHTHTGKLRCS